MIKCTMSTKEIPHYLQYGQQQADKMDSENIDKIGSVSCKEIIVFPALGSTKTGSVEKSFQDPIYPQLISVDARTPLLANKKKPIVPTKTNYFGIFLAFVSGVFFTLCSGTVKYLTDVDPMELLVFRSVFQVFKTLMKYINHTSEAMQMKYPT